MEAVKGEKGRNLLEAKALVRVPDISGKVSEITCRKVENFL